MLFFVMLLLHVHTYNVDFSTAIVLSFSSLGVLFFIGFCPSLNGNFVKKYLQEEKKPQTLKRIMVGNNPVFKQTLLI